jgi:hypothetical protein
MIISDETRQYADEHNANFVICSNLQEYNTRRVNDELPRYMTRLQTKIYSNGRIYISENTLLLDIIRLGMTMQNFCPYIHRYSNKSNNVHSLNITLSEDNVFILEGKNLDLYSFITNSMGLNILTSLWDDNFEMDTKPELLTEDNFIKNINKINYSIDIEQTCIICQNDFNFNSKICKTHCKHVYHKDCLHKWATKFNSSCPMCRTPLDE